MLTKVDLLMLDDLGPDRLTAGQRRDLMEIIEERHGRGSTLIASQLPVKALARSHRRSGLRRCHPRCLIHNAYRLELEGPRSKRETDPEGEVHAASTATPVASNGKSAKGTRK
jgi:DNA replication protein DnaC